MLQEKSLKTAGKLLSIPGKQPVEVLHVIKSLGRGGAETLLAQTLRSHNRENFNFHYLFFLPWKDQMVQEIIGAGGLVTCMPAGSNIGIFLKIKSIIKYIRENRIRIIHCHLPVAGIVGRVAGMVTKVPVIYTEHNKWERYHKITFWLNKLSFSKQHKVIAVSGEVQRSIQLHYRGALPEIKVIANGVDTRKFNRLNDCSRDIRKELNIATTSTVIGIACVFRSQKRLTDWLEIAAAIHRLHPQAVFIVVGDGVMREEIFKKAKMLNTEGYVHFVGLQTEVRPYLQAMDIFMMTSEFEGLPIALLEAMSMECVPACTRAGGIAEVVQDNVNGILVPVNDPMQLVARINDCLNKAGQLDKLRSEARNTIKRSFGMRRMVSEIEDIYHTTLEKKF